MAPSRDNSSRLFVGNLLDGLDEVQVVRELRRAVSGCDPTCTILSIDWSEKLPRIAFLQFGDVHHARVIKEKLNQNQLRPEGYRAFTRLRVEWADEISPLVKIAAPPPAAPLEQASVSKVHPQSVEELRALVATCLQGRIQDGAAAAAERVLLHADHIVDDTRCAAQIHFVTKNYRRAVELSDLIIHHSDNPTSQDMQLAARACEECGELRRAVTYWEASLDIKDDMTQTRRRGAMYAHIKLGNWSMAAEIGEQFLKAEPELLEDGGNKKKRDSSEVMRVALMQRKAGNVERAIKLLEDVMAQSHRDDEIKVMRDLIDSYLDQGNNFERCIQLCKQILAHPAHNIPDARSCALKLGKFDIQRSVDVWESILEQLDDAATTMDKRWTARMHARNYNFRRSVDLWNEVLTDPNHSEEDRRNACEAQHALQNNTQRPVWTLYI